MLERDNLPSLLMYAHCYLWGTVDRGVLNLLICSDRFCHRQLIVLLSLHSAVMVSKIQYWVRRSNWAIFGTRRKPEKERFKKYSKCSNAFKNINYCTNINKDTMAKNRPVTQIYGPQIWITGRSQADHKLKILIEREATRSRGKDTAESSPEPPVLSKIFYYFSID